MKREVILRATGIGPCDNPNWIDPNSNPYPHQASTPSMTLWDVWNSNGTAAPSGTGNCGDGNYAYHGGGYTSSTRSVIFEKGPTLARFTKVSVWSAFDYSQTGPNNWYEGVGAGIVLRNRAGAGWLTSADTGGGSGATPSHVLTAPEMDNTYNNRPANQGFHLYGLFQEWLFHPEGGPFTLEDINNLCIGVVGVDGGFDNSQGSFFKVRIPYLHVVLEVEDLGGYVANMRTASSFAMRMFRRARNTINPKSFIHRAPGGLGDTVYLSHPRGPDVTGAGWGQRRLERHAAMILKRTYEPESFKCEDEMYDLRSYSCLGWGAYRIDAPWNPEIQGLSLVEKGRSFTHARTGDAWSPRPGDGRLMRVLEDYPNVSFHGLACQGGGDTAILKRNYDCHQTGWSTVSSANTFSATQVTNVSMVEEAGYLSSTLLDYGAGGGKGGREKSLGALTTADRLHVRVIIKNTRVDDPTTQYAEWYLRYSTNYWNATTRAWSASPVYNQIPAQNADGETLAFSEVVSDSITLPSNTTYYVGVGRFSSNIGPVQFHAALVDVQKSDSTVAGARTPQVLLDDEQVRNADAHKMEHVYGRELWTMDRGVCVAEFQPFWRAADLPENAVKPILHAQHATNTWDAIQFVPISATADKLRFERAISGRPTFQLDCPIVDANGGTVHLTRDHVVRVWARWLGSEGWNEFGPYSVQIGYMVSLESDGSLVATGTALGTLTVQDYTYARDYLGIGVDESRFLDGYMRMWETRRNPIHGLEAIWRL